ncbi:MAG: tripartite tricarboxylate transporter substrate binding protein [Burkholderiaceae bacterium]|nr:tripartite tricarboxylate transporter substrate binding protein [Burkholderiaceae bacterium]
MKIIIKLLWAVGFACALPLVNAQEKDNYPVRPIHLYVGFAPGGATDQLARLYGMKLGQRLGQPVVVENRSGNGGNIAVMDVAQAKPDGYTLVMGANYVATNAVFKRNPYDWERDLAPVALIASTPNLLVVPASSKFKSLDDIVEATRQPGANVTFGSPGVGSSVHLAGELFKLTAKAPNMTHVPYKGVSLAEIDLAAGNIDLMFDSISTAVPLAEGGKLRALAVTGLQRIKALPNVPSMDELGMKGFDVQATYMIIAPAKTPKSVIGNLSAAIAEITRQPDVQRSIENLYAVPLAGGPEEATAFLRKEQEKWTGIVKASGLKID